MIASKFMIDTGAGVIDADYQGVVYVLLFNHSDQDFAGTSFSTVYNCSLVDQNIVKVGDRVAQLIIERIYNPEVLEVDVSPIQSSSTAALTEKQEP